MHRRTLRAATGLLAFALSAIMAGVGFAAPPTSPAAAAPTLFTLQSATPRALAEGAQKSWPISISEDTAMAAVFSGGMWLPNPAGGREYAKYVKHIVHDNGIWTWIGTVQTVHGPQSVMLTFGEGAVFGTLPQADGYPLRIVTARGQARVLQTSAKAMGRSPTALRLRSRPDYMVPPAALRRAGPSTTGTPARSDAPARADASSAGGSTIDVMVAYTSGFVSANGSTNDALTRIQYLVDYTNQAYVNSGVNAKLRLVHTVKVDYPDNTSNQTALDDITGTDGNGNPVSIPQSLQQVAALRSEYGADLVVLMRSFDNSTQGGCGVGWMIGGNETPISPSSDAMFGYSVVSDGNSGGYYCLDGTFAHEVGHNMGDAHDRANATEAGAYSYSYGYVGNGDDGFSTIMAYGTSDQTPLQVFSNPNISTCQNSPCGVADSSSSSADNAHSMNNTVPLIAQFEPTKTQTVSPLLNYVHNDVNGDGKSDLFWYSKGENKLTYWLMNGASMASWRGFGTSSGYRPVAFGDFNGDGRADILWDNSSTNSVYMWLGEDGGTFTSKFVVTHQAGSSIAGAGDVNGDGNSDIIWFIPQSHKATYWLMDGASMTSWRGFTLPASYQPAGIGDFNGDGHADLLWADSSRHVYMWLNDGDGGFDSHLVNTHQPGWAVAGVGDVDGDGNSDIFWYNQGTGKLSYWLMDGYKMRTWRSFSLSHLNSVAGIGDYDGNGKADVLWSQPQPNRRYLYMWVNNGSGGFNSHFIVHYSNSFDPVD